jgi:hypothetical protein
MTPHIIRISVDDDFGSNSNSYASSLHQQYNINSIPQMPNGIKSISGSEAVVDERILKGRNSWTVVSSLMSRNFSLRDSTQEEFQEHMKRFGTFRIEENSRDEFTLHFDYDNAYDLKLARFIDNDSRGKGFNTMDIWYQNNPINYFFLKDVNGYTSIDIGTFSKSYWVYSESDWWTFMDCLQKGLSIQEIRELKINQILNDSPSEYSNLIRQLNFITKYKSPSNRFLDSVYGFYEKNGFISERQAKAVMKEIW